MVRRGLLSLLSVAACAPMRPIPTASADECKFPKEWVQASLDLWARTTVEVLQSPDAPLPYTIYFDRRCTYTLASPDDRPPAAREIAGLRFRGAPVHAWAERHAGEVELPDGQIIPVGMHAAGGMYEGSEPTPFYAMALLDIWKSHRPRGKQGEHLAEEFLTVAQHELTHTLQLRGISAAVERIADEVDRALDLDDDRIQDLFESDPEYVAAFGEEVQLLFAASLTTDDAEQRRLAGRALELARARQARWFVGDRAMYGELDGLFLSMEGLGEWVRYKLMTSGPVGELPRQTRAQAIAMLQGRHPYWSQDEGLALLLLLEQRHPNFRERLLAEELPDALTLLEESLR